MSINKGTLSVNGIVIGKVESIVASKSLLPPKSLEHAVYIPSEAGPFEVTMTRVAKVNEENMRKLFVVDTVEILKEEQEPQNS